MANTAEAQAENPKVLDFPPHELKRKLHEKIVQMTKAMGKLDEDGQNKHSGYGYISSNQMMSKLRDSLETFKLEICGEVTDDLTTEFQSKNGTAFRRVQVNMEFEIIDLETGYSEIKKWRGADQDSGGKEYQQAITTCTKYFLFKLLKVSSKEEKDPDSQTIPTDSPPNGQSDGQNHGGPPPYLRNSSPREQPPGPPPGGPPPQPRTAPHQNTTPPQSGYERPPHQRQSHHQTGNPGMAPPNSQAQPPAQPSAPPASRPLTPEQQNAIQYLRTFSEMGLLISDERNRLNDPNSDINSKMVVFNEVKPRIDALYADALRNFDQLPENRRLEGLQYRESYYLINYMADIGE